MVFELSVPVLVVHDVYNASDDVGVLPPPFCGSLVFPHRSMVVLIFFDVFFSFLSLGIGVLFPLLFLFYSTILLG